jgi:WD40 repeat protein/tRNA A-37 threonylcarbamoyl transferase component Bud32
MTDDAPTKPAPGTASPAPDPSSLKGLTMALGIGPAEAGQDSLLGRDIGGVTIVRLIAEGGMGRVYEGKQEKPNRTVAVKVMRPGLTSPSVLKRFEYEAEVLGRLQHPGIAHIYSVGVHRLGNATVPYFIMEYIADAKPLTQYANDLKLPTRQRLDLFRNVCDAVAHGHQKGVIHRDLKPSNILVDCSGQPKVIDFGVARATDSDMALTTMQTDVGQLIGTLQYMSPEQFKADPNDIDVRSDVYALGVIFYELLAGKMPYDVKRKAVHEVARIVQEDDPTPLSSFNRALKGDVAVIAGKCLEKDRGRRYSSASELGSDIGRYLSGEPISASPPGFVDGLVRLAKKHRGPALAASAVFGALLLAVVGISFFAIRADQQRQVAVREQVRANENEALAVRAKDAARDQEASAKDRLYRANLYRLGRIMAGERSGNPSDLFDQTGRLAQSESLPIELRVLRAGLDGAAAVYRGCATNAVLAITQDGTLCATSCEDHSLMLCDTGPSYSRRTLPGHTAPLVAIAFSPDGRFVASASRDKTARCWDTATGDQLFVLTGHDEALTDLAVSDDGLRLVTASRDKTARVWDTDSGKQLRVLAAHTGAVKCVCLSRDGAAIATGGEDRVAILWDVATGKKIRTFEGNGDTVGYVAFSPDNDHLAICSNDGFVRVWHVKADAPIAIVGDGNAFLLGRFGEGTPLARFSSDGNTLGTCINGKAPLWDVSSLSVARSETPGDLVTVRSDEQWLEFVILERHESRCVVAPAKDPREVNARTLENKVLVTLASVPRRCTSDDRVTDLRIHPNQRIWLTGLPSGALRIRDVDDGSLKAVMVGHDGAIQVARFAAATDRLVSIASDGCMRVWNIDTPLNGGVALTTQRASLRSRIDGVGCMAVSPDGRRVATGNTQNGLCIWDANTARQVGRRTLPGSHAQGVAYSPDGSRLVAWTLAGAVLYDASTLQIICSETNYPELRRAAAFSADSQWLALGYTDGTVSFFNAETGEAALPWQHMVKERTATVGIRRPELVLEDFEGKKWGKWKTDGSAFGARPAREKTEAAAETLGLSGQGYASSRASPAATGTLSSPVFQLEREYVTFRLMGSMKFYETSASLVVGGTTVCRALPRSWRKMEPVSWNVQEWIGHSAHVEIFDTSPETEGWIAIDRVAQSDAPAADYDPAQLAAHVGSISELAFSPDGSMLATASGIESTVSKFFYGTVGAATRESTGTVPADFRIRLWDLQSGECVATQKFAGTYGLYDRRKAAFSRDSSMLGFGDGREAVVLDVRSRRVVQRLQGHGGDVVAVAFDPTKEFLATGSTDNTARIWSIRTGISEAILNGHNGAVRAVAFSQDGRRLITVGHDGKAYLWDTQSGDVLLALGDERLHVEHAVFAPDDRRIITCSSSSRGGGCVVWGVSNAEIAEARHDRAAIEARLKPMVDKWFAAGDEAAINEVKSQRMKLTDTDYSVVADMVLERLCDHREYMR